MMPADYVCIMIQYNRKSSIKQARKRAVYFDVLFVGVVMSVLVILVLLMTH